MTRRVTWLAAVCGLAYFVRLFGRDFVYVYCVDVRVASQSYRVPAGNTYRPGEAVRDVPWAREDFAIPVDEDRFFGGWSYYTALLLLAGYPYDEDVVLYRYARER